MKKSVNTIHERDDIQLSFYPLHSTILSDTQNMDLFPKFRMEPYIFFGKFSVLPPGLLPCFSLVMTKSR